jgi:hypothetical protein
VHNFDASRATNTLVSRPCHFEFILHIQRHLTGLHDRRSNGEVFDRHAYLLDDVLDDVLDDACDQFSAAYRYVCSIHPAMTGTIVVASGS